MMLTMKAASDISAAVRAEVARAGSSGSKVAAQVGMPYSTWLRRMRTGKWSVSELRDIARALDVPLARLTGDEQ